MPYLTAAVPLASIGISHGRLPAMESVELEDVSAEHLTQLSANTASCRVEINERTGCLCVSYSSLAVKHVPVSVIPFIGRRTFSKSSVKRAP